MCAFNLQANKTPRHPGSLGGGGFSLDRRRPYGLFDTSLTASAVSTAFSYLLFVIFYFHFHFIF